jgi:hypothetical protein
MEHDRRLPLWATKALQDPSACLPHLLVSNVKRTLERSVAANLEHIPYGVMTADVITRDLVTIQIYNWWEQGPIRPEQQDELYQQGNSPRPQRPYSLQPNRAADAVSHNKNYGNRSKR